MAKEGKDSRSPPQLDYSSGTIRKTIVSTSLQHPLTIVPLAIAGVGAIAAAAINPAFVLVAIGMGALGLGSGVVNLFFRSDAIAYKYMQEQREKLDAYKREKIEQIRFHLRNLRSILGAEAFCDQAVRQFGLIEAAYQSYQEVLSAKAQTSEITFGRFMTPVEQAYLKVLDNLKNVVTILRSIQPIDHVYSEQRLAALLRIKQPSAIDLREIQTLTERIELRRNHLQEVDTILTSNEELITTVSRNTTRLLGMKNLDDYAKMDTGDIFEELQRLSEQVESYR